MIRHCSAWPLSGMSGCAGTPAAHYPNDTAFVELVLDQAHLAALRDTDLRLHYVDAALSSQVTVCSTWMRGFTSDEVEPRESTSIRNSTVPAWV